MPAFNNIGYGVAANPGGTSLPSLDTVKINGVDYEIDIPTDNVSLSNGAGYITSVSHSDLSNEFKISSPLTADADLDIDFSTAAIFTTSSSIAMDLNFTNAGIGHVKTIVVTDSGGTSSLTFDTTTNTIAKLNGDYSATAGTINYIQVHCIASNSFILTISQA